MRIVQITELRLPVELDNGSSTVLQQVNDQSISSVNFLVYTLLCVGSWSRGTLTVGDCGPKTGEMLGGVKYHCLECKRQFARSRQISEFHIFAPRNAAPCIVPPGADAPLLTATESALTWRPITATLNGTALDLFAAQI